MAQTTYSGVVNSVTKTFLAGSDGTNIASGLTLFDANGTPIGSSANPLITKKNGLSTPNVFVAPTVTAAYTYQNGMVVGGAIRAAGFFTTDAQLNFAGISALWQGSANPTFTFHLIGKTALTGSYADQSYFAPNPADQFIGQWTMGTDVQSNTSGLKGEADFKPRTLSATTGVDLWIIPVAGSPWTTTLATDFNWIGIHTTKP